MNVRPVVEDDLTNIIPLLREHDRKTAERLGVDPIDVLRYTFERGSPMQIALVEGRPLAMWGVEWKSLLSVPSLWMITTDEVQRNPIAFLRESRRVVKEWGETYGSLEGMVDSDFETSLRWLRWLGFHEVESLDGFKKMRYP